MNAIPTEIVQRSRRSGYLYLGTAALLALIAVAGFGESYWIPLLGGALEIPAILHLHGMLFFAWMGLSVAQAALVTSGRTSWHREAGLAGIALASAMVFSGVLAQIVQTRQQLAGPRPEVAMNVAALGFSAMLMFAVFVALAVANVRRPAIHRRLMVMASFAIIGAAVVRLFRFVPGTTQAERALMGAAAVDVLLLAVIWLDRRSTGRIHPAWLWGAGFLLLNQVGRALIARTDGWARFTGWVAGLGG